MRIALIGDVHANLPALEAVLADARGLDAEAVWNRGDLVGYGPFPEETIQLLRDEAAVNVLGNYDAKVLAFERKRKKWRKTKESEKYLALGWAHENISSKSLHFLQWLPVERRIAVDRLRVLLLHGSPAGKDDAVGPNTPDDHFDRLALMADADVVACGHSHRPLVRCVAGVWFVNPGSVGRPEGGDPRASYALVDFTADGPAVEHRRVSYDVVRTIDALRSAGLPDDFAQMFRCGVNLKQAQQMARMARFNDPTQPHSEVS